MEKTPEFDIFGRVENLEKKLQGEVTVNDAFILALLGFRLAYFTINAVGIHDIDYFKKQLLKLMDYYRVNKKLVTIMSDEMDFMRDNIIEYKKLLKRD